MCAGGSAPATAMRAPLRARFAGADRGRDGAPAGSAGACESGGVDRALRGGKYVDGD
jgi:hypothetical protein